MNAMPRLKALNIVLFALALLAQVLMPAAMARASTTTSDLFAHAIICGDTAEDAASSDSAPHTLGMHDQCALCQAGGLHLATIQGLTEFALISYPIKRQDFWTDPENLETGSWPSLQAPPRGPPSLV